MTRDTHAALTAPEPSFLLRGERKETERSFSYRCCIENCNNNNKSPGVKFTTIPKKPVSKADMKKTRNVLTFLKNLLHHELIMERCSIISPKKWSQNTRYCSAHATENVRLKKKVDVCGVVEEIEFEYKNVPK